MNREPRDRGRKTLCCWGLCWSLFGNVNFVGNCTPFHRLLRQLAVLHVLAETNYLVKIIKISFCGHISVSVRNWTKYGLPGLEAGHTRATWTCVRPARKDFITIGIMRRTSTKYLSCDRVLFVCWGWSYIGFWHVTVWVVVIVKGRSKYLRFCSSQEHKLLQIHTHSSSLIMTRRAILWKIFTHKSNRKHNIKECTPKLINLT